MAFCLRQYFTTGRFHATRWGENPAADAYGEWPPSPWRLLRALAAAWFEGGHQTGISAAAVRSALQRMAAAPPLFWLPSAARRAGPIKQYHPKAKHAPDVLGVTDTTLAEDHFFAVPADEPVWWIWDDLELEAAERRAIDELTSRLRYFGRAESLCRIEVGQDEDVHPAANSGWERRQFPGCRPVLCASPERFQPEHVLERTGDMLKQRRARLPLGAEYVYYGLPPKAPRAPSGAVETWPEGVRCVQFALGGRVWPSAKFVVSIAERFRGIALKRYAQLKTGDGDARFDPDCLSESDWSVNLSGKLYGGEPGPVGGHRHAYYLPQLDENGAVTRLVVWSHTPFRRDELRALCEVERIYWGSGDYPLRVVWLPFETPEPQFLRRSEAQCWKAQTPFVPPRFTVGRTGKPRRGQSPRDQVRDLLIANGHCRRDTQVRIDVAERAVMWVLVHRGGHRGESARGREVQVGEVRVVDCGASPSTRRGFPDVEIHFGSPVCGPILLGHSTHFGLGQFRPVRE